MVKSNDVSGYRAISELVAIRRLHGIMKLVGFSMLRSHFKNQVNHLAGHDEGMKMLSCQACCKALHSRNTYFRARMACSSLEILIYTWIHGR